jgi:hypothetical protein
VAPSSGVVQEAYTYTASVSGLGSTPVYALTLAPAGMIVDPNGAVNWTPSWAQLGSFGVTLTASGEGRTIEQSWTLIVHQDLLFGVAYSPQGHTSSSTEGDIVRFLREHEPWGRLIAFHSAWRDSVETAGEIPQLAQFAVGVQDVFEVEAAIGIGWAAGDGSPDLVSESEPANNSWTNQETRDEFLALVTDFAATFEPTYLFLGNEINFWYLDHPGDWIHWMSELEACYDAIKLVSPDTTVFTVFQLERLKGLGAGTTGWSDPPQWHLVDELAAAGKIDAIGFTSYPYFEYDIPADIPADYYDEISAHWTGPVIFTELGWPATAFPPFPGGVNDQADFIDVFLERSEDLDLEYAAWLFLHDWDGQATIPAFFDIGLRSNDGSLVRPSDERWTSAVALRERP